MKRIIPVAYFTICTMLLLLRTAFAAYIDPAATSYIIQIVAGVFIAGGVTVGIFWKKIRMSFRNKKMQRLEKSLSKKADKK